MKLQNNIFYSSLQKRFLQLFIINLFNKNEILIFIDSKNLINFKTIKNFQIVTCNPQSMKYISNNICDHLEFLYQNISIILINKLDEFFNIFNNLQNIEIFFVFKGSFCNFFNSFELLKLKEEYTNFKILYFYIFQIFFFILILILCFNILFIKILK
jgi:hypothetical protein